MYCGQPEGGADRARRHGIVNGVYCTDILVDTGATQTMVHKDLVDKGDILDGEATIRCAHGDTTSYPLAVVKIAVGGKDIVTTAAVSSTLPASVLLGWDVPELTNFVADEQTARNPADALAVMTRLRRRQQLVPENQEPVINDAEAFPDQAEQQSTPVPETPETDPETYCVFNFEESLFTTTGPPKPALTRAQKRENRRQYRHVTEGAGQSGALNVTPEELRRLQDSDESLDRPRLIADGALSAAAGEQFFRQDGLVYRRYTPAGSDGDAHSVDQLVLPTQLRPAVLRLAHDIPMAGHLGRQKTMDRIRQRFYWPKVYHDVKNHCRTCAQCQKSSMKGVRKAPLVPLPIMDEPFQRIAMDIVGPLPRSSSGKRYILVICDYATRYPEAVALRTIDTNAVAEELLTFFSRVGVPEEILTDQGTNFMSQLLSEVYRLLKIKPIRTTPYHPQTDGLVERFNGTLKAMLKKAASEDGRDWDRLLPYLLFAYREVPQA